MILFAHVFIQLNCYVWKCITVVYSVYFRYFRLERETINFLMQPKRNEVVSEKRRIRILRMLYWPGPVLKHEIVVYLLLRDIRASPCKSHRSEIGYLHGKVDGRTVGCTVGARWWSVAVPPATAYDDARAESSPALRFGVIFKWIDGNSGRRAHGTHHLLLPLSR